MGYTNGPIKTFSAWVSDYPEPSADIAKVTEICRAVSDHWPCQHHRRQLEMTISLKAGVDPTLPDVSLEIGGKTRQLAYDFAAIIRAEKLTGVNLMKACTFQDLNLGEVRGLLYAALLHADPDLTLEEVDTWPILYNLIAIQGAVASAWFGSVPAAKDDAPGEGKAQVKKTRKRQP